jgi:hypothetical protein
MENFIDQMAFLIGESEYFVVEVIYQNAISVDLHRAIRKRQHQYIMTLLISYLKVGRRRVQHRRDGIFPKNDVMTSGRIMQIVGHHS